MLLIRSQGAQKYHYFVVLKKAALKAVTFTFPHCADASPGCYQANVSGSVLLRFGEVHFPATPASLISCNINSEKILIKNMNKYPIYVQQLKFNFLPGYMQL